MARRPYASRGTIPAYQLAQDFISDEVVYVVQGVEVNLGKPRLPNAERYLNGDQWFKVFLHIHTDGHLGEYVATIVKLLPRRVLDDSGHGRHSDLIRHQMKTRVLEAIVQSGKDGERMAICSIASMVRLYIINQSAYRVGNINEAGIVDSDTLAPRLLSSDRKALRLDLLSDGGNAGANQVVKNRSQMVNGFVSEQEDRGWGINELKAIEVIRTIAIFLAAEGPWITRLIAPDDTSQMAQVLACPTELELEPVWRREGIYCSHGRQEDAEGLHDTSPDSPRDRGRAGQDGQADEAIADLLHAHAEEVPVRI